VQLEHDSKETSWENHGFVIVKSKANGKVIVQDDAVQHNRNYGKRAETLNKMVEAVKAHFK